MCAASFRDKRGQGTNGCPRSVTINVERLKLLPAILLVILAFGVLTYSIHSTPLPAADEQGLSLLAPDKVRHAPEWTLPNAATGKLVRLSEQTRNGPVVFSFWATWCGPCQEELPHLSHLSRKYAGRVAFFGVNADDPPDKAAQFFVQNKVAFPVLADVRRDAITKYGVDSLPTLLVVDRHGSVRAATIGYDESGGLEASLSHILDTLLAEPASPVKEPVS